ncbi:MAG: hypothetical protein BWZ10_02241 [candidate division BRC1 bacterium ADurb.BinA364]|nr:MAG: hypothetical protein BWZ10_02241 [candidate division BRC1 bacterium ADurb.BinA364]
MIALISDLLHPADSIVAHLKSLRAMRHDVMALQIADPAEQTFPFEENATFVDVEDRSERYAAPAGARLQYLENRRRHFDSIRRECLAHEIDIEEFSTAEPLDRALRFFLRRRNRALLASSWKRARASGGGGPAR